MSNILALLKAASIAVITDAAGIDKESKSLAKAIGTQDKRIQSYLFSEMLHIEEHRNTTRLNTFFTNIRETGARVNAMHSFVQAYLNVRFNADYNKDAGKATFEKDGYFPYYTMRDKRDEKLYETKVTAAIAKPWWKHQPEREVADFDMADKVSSTMQALWRAALTAKKSDKIDASLLHDLTNVCIQHGFDVGKLVPNVPSDKITAATDTLKHLTVIRAENSNITVKADVKAPKPETNAEGDKVIPASVEKRGRKTKAA